MPAQAQPKGSVPEKHGKSQDVKEAETPSDSATDENEGSKPDDETSSKSTDDETDVSEEDLKEHEEESKKVPYSRFKEMNQKAKDFEARLKEKDQRFQEDLRREVELAEIRLKQTLRREQELQAEDESLDPQERELKAIRRTIADLREENRSLRVETNSKLMQDQVARLEKIYPKTLVLAALGLKKHDPSISLEEACEDFYSDTKELANQQLRQIIEKKKSRSAKASIPLKESGIKLKESERPKTLAEASKAIKKLFTR